MKTLRRLTQIVWVALTYGLLPELKLGSKRKLSRPVRLRLALAKLGATWVKLGQALALRFDILPPSYCDELFHLLNGVTPFPYADVERIIRSDFGCDISEVFSSFDPRPFAAASIGQVHRARLPSGHTVAVKVQRPGIEDLLSTDIKLMYRLSFVADLLRVFGGTRTIDVIDEFSRWLEEELDYVTEAMNAYTIRENSRFDPIEYNPMVWLEYSTPRVLTLEYLEGIPVSDILAGLRRDRSGCAARLAKRGYDLHQIAANIEWNLLNQVYVIGFFHADLHPANLLVLPGNRIGYVDFGITGRLRPEVRESLLIFNRSLINGDVHRAVAELTRWVMPSSRTDQQEAQGELKAICRRYLFDLRVAHQSKQSLSAAYQVATLAAIRRHQMSVDPAILSYLKAVITIDSITHELSPALDLVEHEQRFFSAMTLEAIYGSASPSALANSVMDYRYRIDRALDLVDTVVPAERAIGDIVGTARTWLERLATLAVIGVSAVYLWQRFTGHSHGVFSTNAGFVLVAVLGLFMLAVLRQTRKLPGTRASGRRRHGLKPRPIARPRNGWSASSSIPAPGTLSLVQNGRARGPSASVTRNG